MKVKRIISAFAALAMSVSCLAGLTITANAEATDLVKVSFASANDKEIEEAKTTIEGAFPNVVTVDYNASSLDEAKESRQKAVEGDWLKLNTYHSSKGVVDSYGFFSSVTVDISKADNFSSIGPNDKVTAEFNVAYGNLKDKKTTVQLLDDTETNEVITAYGRGIYSNITDPDDMGLGADIVNQMNGGNISDYVSDANKTYTHFKYILDYARDTITCEATPYSNSSAQPTVTKSKQLNGKKLGKIVISTDHANMSRACAVKDINVSYEAGQTVTMYSYTLSYKDGDNVVAKEEDRVESGTKIDVKTTNIQGTEDGYTDKKYKLTDEEQTKQFTIDEDNKQCEVKVEEMPYRMLKAVAKCDESEIETLAEETKIYDDGTSKLTYSFPKYMTNAQHKVTYQTNEKPFAVSKSYEDGASATTFEVPYEAYTGNAWFWEGEEISGGGNNQKANDGSSGGYVGYRLDGKTITVPESGMYNIECRTTSAYTVTIYKTNQDGDVLLQGDTADVHSNDGIRRTDAPVALRKDDVLCIKVGHGYKEIDYFLLEKTADIDPVAEVVERAPWSGLNPVTGSLEGGPTFDDLKNDLETKIFSVTVYDEKTEVPKLKIENYDNGEGKGVEFDPGWKTVAKDGARTFYVQFMASADNFAQFGKVTATYGEKTLTLTLTE